MGSAGLTKIGLSRTDLRVIAGLSREDLGNQTSTRAKTSAGRSGEIRRKLLKIVVDFQKDCGIVDGSFGAKAMTKLELAAAVFVIGCLVLVVFHHIAVLADYIAHIH